MRKQLLAVGIVALLALAGCSALQGNDQPGVENGVTLDDNSTGATNVSHSVGIEVTDSVAGEELSEIGVTYPRDQFTVDSAQHEAVRIGVDTDGDGEGDRTFDPETISGVNNNAFSFDVTLDTDYTLQTGDVVFVEYPDVDNPSEPGEYTAEVRLNGQQTTDATVRIG